jgi:hypothetical protein
MENSTSEIAIRVANAELALEKLQNKIKQLYHFIEMTDALTYDPKTSARISLFLKEEGVWK